MIDQAFVSAFIAENFGLPIAHENAAYVATDAPYVELRVQQNRVTPFTLADVDETNGYFEFILRYPLQAGAMNAKAMCETIFSAFPVGRHLNYGNESVQIVGRHRIANRPDGGAYLVIGRLFYRAFTSR
jgi:hypothetical protein